MLIKDVGLGVEIICNGETCIYLGPVPGEDTHSYVLIGFTPGMIALRYWFKDQHRGFPLTNKLLERAGCDRGFWIDKNTKVEIVGNTNVTISTSSQPKGCFCKRCCEFSPFATPNRPDGVSFLCYTCRSNYIEPKFR